MRKLYTIRDVLAGYGCVPGVPSIMDMPTDDYAKRVLRGSCAKGQKANVLNTNPEDKEIWCVGEFDERTGEIIACKPYLVGRAIDYVNKEEIIEDELLQHQSTEDAEGN